MAKVQLFLTTVSAEFLSYRERLRYLLTRLDLEVKVQEDFIVTGDETLEKLDRYIQGCMIKKKGQPCSYWLLDFQVIDWRLGNPTYYN